MVMISNEEINAIRKNCNIVDIISSYVPVTLKGKIINVFVLFTMITHLV